MAEGGGEGRARECVADGVVEEGRESIEASRGAGGGGEVRICLFVCIHMCAP